MASQPDNAHIHDPSSAAHWRRKAAAARGLATSLSRAGQQRAEAGMIGAAAAYDRMADLLDSFATS